MNKDNGKTTQSCDFMNYTSKYDYVINKISESDYHVNTFIIKGK